MPGLSLLSPSRREVLRLGGLGALGLLGATDLKAATTPAPAASPGFGRAKSVILVYCCGGQSQFETWDPKPDAPDVVRGAFEAVPTAVPGTFIGEHLPRIA